MAVSFQYYCRRGDFLFTSDSPPVKVYCSFHYSTCSSIRHINVSYSSVDHGKISDFLQASAEKLPVSLLVLAFCFWGFKSVIYVGCIFDYRTMGLESTSGDPLIHALAQMAITLVTL